MQIRMPRLSDAHSGLAAPQSQHAVLPGTCCKVSSVPPLAGRAAGAADARTDAKLLLALADAASWLAAAASTPEAPGDRAAPALPGDACSLMAGRLGEGCSLFVKRDERDITPLPKGASPKLRALISELMLHAGRHEGVPARQP
jgi:hypothetical protein